VDNAAVEERARGEAAGDEAAETDLHDRAPVRRFKWVAFVAIVAALVPYLWVLWDLWTGTLDPFRITGTKVDPGSVIFDQQARALMHGHLALPQHSIGDEAFIHDGRTYTYFGLFPSLIRMPILLLTHALDGRLSAPSMLAAWIVTAIFTSLLVWRVRVALRGDASLGWSESVSYGLLIFSILAGSVLMSLASVPWVYNEDEAWSVALAIGSIFVLVGLIERPSWNRLTACGVLVLLTNLNRATTGYACILATFLVAAWFALGRGGPERRRWAVPLFSVGVVALLVGCAIDLAKFSQLFGYPSSEQLLFKLFAMDQVNGGKRYSMHFLPSTLAAYLSPLNVRLTSVFPFLTFPAIPSQLVAHTQLFNRGDTASVTASMPLLFGAGLWGVITTFAPGRPTIVRAFRLILIAAAASAGALLIYGSIFERFLGDFMPVLVLGSALGVVDLWGRLSGRFRSGRILVSTIAVAALFGFVANVGIAVAPQLYWTESQSRNYVHAAEVVSNVTGRPLSGDVVRTGSSFPSRATDGQLLIEGRCHALYLAYENAPLGGPWGRNPWLPVEHAPHAPICDSLVSSARNVSLGTSIRAPLEGQTVQGPDVSLVARTSGVGKVSDVTFVIAKSLLRARVKLQSVSHHGRTWTYHWDSRTVPNGSYLLLSTVKNSLGYAAVAPAIRITVANSGR
jgi:hypothetical protein